MKPLRGVSLWGPLGGSSWEATATCSRPRESLEMYSFENLFSFFFFLFQGLPRWMAIAPEKRQNWVDESPFVSVIYSFSFFLFFFFPGTKKHRVGPSFVRAFFLCASEAAAGAPLTLDTARLGGLLMAREGKRGESPLLLFPLVDCLLFLAFLGFGVIVLRRRRGRQVGCSSLALNSLRRS